MKERDKKDISTDTLAELAELVLKISIKKLCKKKRHRNRQVVGGKFALRFSRYIFYL